MLSALIALALAASPALATPMDLPVLVARQDFGACRNQSCLIATVAGSTGATVYPYSQYPTGDNKDGDCCIIRHFPAIKDEVYSERPGLQAYCASNGGDAPLEPNPPGVTSVTIANGARATPAAQKEKRATVTCTPNILIFVKGTLEPGETGITIGPALKGKLDKKLWTTVGVNYDNSFGNDYCLGLPGNINTRAVLAKWTAQCPNSNIAMSGYSQGAMVVRNALARAPISDVKRVTQVVNFGDPFVGAKIGQYNGGVHVFCMAKDGVCNGQLDISLAHLSYGMDVTPAAQILINSQKTS